MQAVPEGPEVPASSILTKAEVSTDRSLCCAANSSQQSWGCQAAQERCQRSSSRLPPHHVFACLPMPHSCKYVCATELCRLTKHELSDHQTLPALDWDPSVKIVQVEEIHVHTPIYGDMVIW